MFLIYVSPVGNCFKEGLSCENYWNYAAAQSEAKAKGFSDVRMFCILTVFIRYLEVSSCNIFVVKVEERPVTVDELLDADEIFCTGTAVIVSSPVGSITYMDRRLSYGEDSVGVVSRQLYNVLTRLQMGLTKNKIR
ncbi:hypothetical protein K2173_014669 [Erythroxylum novogranatense]|uniref:Branched-chain amino acid aminotransferase n=1 Tax=Erythroxylum novogranatense TaxID=1862640 RepID=A0AAV8TF82_9ROSI|nr:hypothetical protein K2173_014669 [Erythroxylum novogranatense]